MASYHHTLALACWNLSNLFQRPLWKKKLYAIGSIDDPNNFTGLWLSWISFAGTDPRTLTAMHLLHSLAEEPK